MVKMKSFSHWLVVLMVLGSLTACGFHLRGSVPLPESMKVLYLNVPEGTFRDALESALERAGATVVENRQAAQATIDVLALLLDREVGTLDDRGKANSYNLVLSVKYELLDPEDYIISARTIKESRLYNYDPELVIESEAEERDLKEDMEEDLALRIIRQIISVAATNELKAKQSEAKSSNVQADDKQKQAN